MREGLEDVRNRVGGASAHGPEHTVRNLPRRGSRAYGERMGRDAPVLPPWRSRRMRRSRMVALTGAVALATTAFGATRRQRNFSPPAPPPRSTLDVIDRRVREVRRPGRPRGRRPRRRSRAAQGRRHRDLGEHRHRPDLGEVDLGRLPDRRRAASPASRGRRATASSAVPRMPGGCRTACSRSTRPPRAGRPGPGRPRRARRSPRRARPTPTRSTAYLWGMDMINAPAGPRGHAR